MLNAWEPLLTGLLALSALGVCVSTMCHVLVWHVVRHRCRSQQPSPDSVTILRPLCGVDACLAENLQACTRQSHRPLNMVLGVADQDDAALPVALRFVRDSLELPTRVSVGEDESLENPKVALLERMSWHSDGDWVVVSDSNVRVSPDYVRDALSHAAPDVGLITHLVAGCGGRSFASFAENLQLNCFVAPAVCGARFLVGQTCVIGKSMFLRRQALQDIGGFKSAGHFLAEDYVIGQAIVRAGYRVVTAAQPVPAWHEGWTLGRFIGRHLRWAVMRRSVSRSAYLVELLLNPAPFLMLLWVLSHFVPLPGIRPLWLLVALCLEQALAAVSFSRMTGQLVPGLALLSNPVRQWLTLGIWVLGWFVETVEWRGKAYRVGAGSVLRPATGPVPARVVER
ncbi:MAG: glycosyltransferase [Deltaproteobacteria bacterium]